MTSYRARATAYPTRRQCLRIMRKRTALLVYGYLKDSGDKNQWVIDEVAAPIVRRIFRMILEGYGPYQRTGKALSQWLGRGTSAHRFDVLC